MKELRTVLLGQKLKIYTGHKNLTYKNSNTNHMLQWRLILEEYGLDIQYIPGVKTISVDALSQLPNNGNQENTHESTYTTETMPELYDIEELPGDMFPLSFKLVYRYQREDPLLTPT